MTTDREMLEFAAKSIGHTLYWTGEEGHGDSFIYFGPDISNWTPFSGHDKFELGKTKRWNPLTDDGDALRLAIKLRLCIDNCVGEEGDRNDVTVGEEAGFGVFVDEYHGADPYAATRRAIVRAAAKIGGMK